MQNILKIIDFGNEAADDTPPHELESYFVEQESFAKFLSPTRRLLIAHARKGVGKSALLKWTALKQQKNDSTAVVIDCRGSDVSRIPSNSTNPNDQIADWTAGLFNLVSRKLAEITGCNMLSDDITAVSHKDITKFRGGDLPAMLLQRLLDHAVLARPADIDLHARITAQKQTSNVWILIDDLDATYQNTASESTALATFFSACRYMIQDVKGVCIRVTMRTDVWAMIRRHDEATDKLEQYVYEILWSQRDFLNLLALRIDASLKSLQIDIPKPPPHVQAVDAQERLLELVLEPRMEWGSVYRTDLLGPQKFVAAYKILYTLSYERPRWAIQLCKLARDSALHHHATRITKDHIDEIWGEYGARRVADLVAEHKHQCRQINELLNAFRGANRLMTRGELFAWITNRISNHLEPRIEGIGTRSPREIAQFLFRIGFILARSERKDHSYEHYRYDQMPDFLTSRTDDDFGLKWEIHPCYREALDIQKLNLSHKERFGRLRRRY